MSNTNRIFRISLYSCKDINLLFLIFNRTILNFRNNVAVHLCYIYKENTLRGLLLPAIIEPLNK